MAAPIDVTWSALADIASHVEWMADAESITFTTDQRRGEGTVFECRTKVGPLRTLDKMTVTEWVDGVRMAVSHNGIVQGVGVFELASPTPTTTQFSWTEDLRFPALPRRRGRRFRSKAGASSHLAGQFVQVCWPRRAAASVLEIMGISANCLIDARIWFQTRERCTKPGKTMPLAKATRSSSSHRPASVRNPASAAKLLPGRSAWTARSCCRAVITHAVKVSLATGVARTTTSVASPAATSAASLPKTS